MNRFKTLAQKLTSVEIGQKIDKSLKLMVIWRVVFNFSDGSKKYWGWSKGIKCDKTVKYDLKAYEHIVGIKGRKKDGALIEIQIHTNLKKNAIGLTDPKNKGKPFEYNSEKNYEIVGLLLKSTSDSAKSFDYLKEKRPRLNGII